jgi:hypothetical protein
MQEFEPLDVLRQFNQAVDPNPDQNDSDSGGAMRIILTTSQAVTDPVPDQFGVLANLIPQLLR